MSEYVAALRKRWLVILLLAVIGAGLGYWKASSTEPLYRSTSKVYVSLTRGDTVGDLVQGSTYTRNLVESFAQLATMPVVLQPVIDDLDLGITPRALAGAVSADSPLDTVIIEISATSRSPQRAAAIANSVAKHLSTTVKDLSPTSEDGASTVQMSVVSPAAPPSYAFSPNTKLLTATGGLVGIGIGIVVALAWTLLDTRVRSARDIPARPERVLLGTVPQDRAVRRWGARAIVESPHAPLAEAYRRVRTNLQFLDVAKPVHSIVVSSAVPGEGKSLTSINLALIMAERGRRVLLVDADMRRQTVAGALGIEGGAGLSTVLVGDATLADVAQPWAHENLEVVTAGATPPNPGQLVDSEAMGEFIAAATATYDLVVIDTPPLLAVADAAVLSRRVDGVVVVVGCNHVRRTELADALATLDAIDATCLGVVLNKTSEQAGAYTYTSTRRRRSIGRRRMRRLPTDAIARPGTAPSAHVDDDDDAPQSPPEVVPPASTTTGAHAVVPAPAPAVDHVGDSGADVAQHADDEAAAHR
ncbi:polysaccharide biosynthesis tyrosine autokinase [Cellulomonas sp. HZM]|uniref:polysaccharide biosynthesis tyrosine autokinase n=1 Tax=Cellulomonas sp. HZM TaxID=1454010 RepID=UPI00068CADDD|nr:polysaccharide biosynthesis tyrosine autokinase [Cellulomonas sp. HZM]